MLARGRVRRERGLLGSEQLDVFGAREGVGGEEDPEGEQLGEDEEPDRQVAGQAGAMRLCRSAGRHGALRSGDGIHAAQSRQKGALLT